MFLDIEEELEPFYYPKMLKMINANETLDLIYVKGLPFSTYALRGRGGVKDITNFCVRQD